MVPIHKHTTETFTLFSMTRLICMLCTYREPNFGSGVFHIYNSTVATWSWHVDMNGTAVVTDSVTIVHDYTQCPCGFHLYPANVACSKVQAAALRSQACMLRLPACIWSLRGTLKRCHGELTLP